MNDEQTETQSPRPIKLSRRLTRAAVRIALCRKQEGGDPLEGGHGTGFLWLAGDTLYLITTWHNVTVWDPIRDRALDEKKAFGPDCVQFVIGLEKDAGSGLIIRDHRNAVLDLLDAEGKAEWLEHPKWGRSVDVVALEIGPLDGAKLFHQPINTHAFDNFEPAVGDDAFVIGFPMGMDGGSGFPIWKRASIASEPDIDLDGLPKLLIDTATRKGMSGSPVIAVRRGIIKPRGSIEFKDTIIGQGEEFLGVYSGRIGDDEMGVQLGVVWKASVVEEIVAQGVPGKTPFD